MNENRIRVWVPGCRCGRASQMHDEPPKENCERARAPRMKEKSAKNSTQKMEKSICRKNSYDERRWDEIQSNERNQWLVYTYMIIYCCAVAARRVYLFAFYDCIPDVVKMYLKNRSSYDSRFNTELCCARETGDCVHVWLCGSINSRHNAVGRQATGERVLVFPMNVFRWAAEIFPEIVALPPLLIFISPIGGHNNFNSNKK